MDTAEVIAQWEKKNILENKIIKFLTEDNFIIQWVKNKYLGIFHYWAGNPLMSIYFKMC